MSSRKGNSTVGGTPPPSNVAFHTHTLKQIQEAGGKNFDFADEFVRYRRNGEYRVLRSDFPQLMGWSTLRRPKGLPRSLKTPYFAGKYAPLSLAKERVTRPHANRLRPMKDLEEVERLNLIQRLQLESGDANVDVDGNAKVSVDLDDYYDPIYELDAEDIALGRLTHEEAEKVRNEPKRLLTIRRKMFKHFKLFREDYARQPAFQEGEITILPGTLANAQRTLGPTSYGVFEVEQNVVGQHKDERLYKEEYWPALHVFNPIKCRYLGINRLYCKTRTYPVPVNLARLADKFIPSYGPPPPRKFETEVANLDEEEKLVVDLK